MREVGIVSGARSYFGTLAPIIREIEKTPKLDYWLYVMGVHLCPWFGSTVDEIES